MTNIDLTHATTAAARETRARVLTRQEHPAITTLDAMDDLNGHRRDWDQISLTEQNLWREEVLPAIWAAHRDIARQAWEDGYWAGTDHERTAPDVHHTLNPYAEETR